jgi:hypothetical protein
MQVFSKKNKIPQLTCKFLCLAFAQGFGKKNRKNILYTVRGASTSVARFVLPAGKQVCRQSVQPSQQA